MGALNNSLEPLGTRNKNKVEIQLEFQTWFPTLSLKRFMPHDNVDDSVILIYCIIIPTYSYVMYMKTEFLTGIKNSWVYNRNVLVFLNATYITNSKLICTIILNLLKTHTSTIFVSVIYIGYLKLVVIYCIQVEFDNRVNPR